ncbi:RDD family protein [Consotaella aegiceratis]|uniref:RDD family protein n=1 Tax=Consotaella aegiceratis TaxID=3097961 RepID=UPI002F409BB1
MPADKTRLTVPEQGSYPSFWRIRIDGRPDALYGRRAIALLLDQGTIDYSTPVFDPVAGAWRSIVDIEPLKHLIWGSTSEEEAAGPAPQPVAPTVADLYRFAGFWIRIAAWIIDLAVIFLAFVVLAVAVTYAIDLAPASDLIDLYPADLELVYGLLCVLAMIGYYVVLHGGPRQATFGKRAVGIRVIKFNGEDVGYGLALLRWICMALSLMSFLCFIFMNNWNRYKITMHDYFCSTFVVYDDWRG